MRKLHNQLNSILRSASAEGPRFHHAMSGGGSPMSLALGCFFFPIRQVRDTCFPV
jgi:hypothetical protein